MVDYKIYSLTLALDIFGRDEISDSFKKFSCSADTDLENFLVQKAIDYEERGKGKTFLLID